MNRVPFHETVSPRACLISKHTWVSVVALAGLALVSVTGGYLATELPKPGGEWSLLLGFGPLIGWFISIVAVTILFLIPTCSIAEILATDDDDARPEVSPKRKWRSVLVYFSDRNSQYLALKEHSPPLYTSRRSPF